MNLQGRNQAAAKQAVLDRMAAIEAAVADLRDRAISFPRYEETQTGAFQNRLQNRILSVALLLTHLEDATRRLVRRLGYNPAEVSRSVETSLALKTLHRLANSWKHGLGGKRSDGAVLNGILMVQRRSGSDHAVPEPDATVHALGMLVADSDNGACPSSTVIEIAIRHWGTILSAWIPEATDWASRCVPNAKSPDIQLKSDDANVVPPGSTVVAELPAEIIETFLKETRRRIAES
jgi:hypothetical protein